ncbi:MAG: hypothetical protein NTZ83_06195 [Candidatus Pacearchaeota archaeon]|nr:hypothetical protein [Candidatus Pacearchaeota archaeon]
MKKSLTIFGIIICTLIYAILISAEANITGEAVTGKALQSLLALNITVTPPVPVLLITSPKNETYITNESLLINYSAVNADTVWYNFDLGSNTTLIEPVYVNVSQGFHTLYIYANNTYELTTKNVSFIANSSVFTILFEEYKWTNKGNSTNFLSYTYKDLQSLGSIILENTNYGKILFGEAINVTNDNINTDNLLDLDSNTEISSNHIELNSAELPNFNTSATLWLYNLSFSNPRILKDGAVCPSNECIKETYTYPSGAGGDGILRFYVTHFTTYSAEETPSNPPGGGTKGGGGTEEEEIIENIEVEEPEKNITIISKEITISVEQGKTTTENFYLSSNYDGKIKVNVLIYGIEQFATISETEFELSYKEIKTLKLNFSIPEGTLPDNYIGKILVKTYSGETYESFVFVNVQSTPPLFDVSLKINEEKLPATSGEYVFFKTIIYNLGETKGIDINIKYTMKDRNGKIIFEGEGIERIENYLEKDGKIKLPKKIYPGRYILSAKVDYEGKTAITSANFDVQEKRLATIWKILIAIAVIFAVLFILWIIGRKEREKEKRKQEEREEKLSYED